jgi:hypothetical protein
VVDSLAIEQARQLRLQHEAALLELDDVIVRDDVNVKRCRTLGALEALSTITATDENSDARMQWLVAEACDKLILCVVATEVLTIVTQLLHSARELLENAG